MSRVPDFLNDISARSLKNVTSILSTKSPNSGQKNDSYIDMDGAAEYDVNNPQSFPQQTDSTTEFRFPLQHSSEDERIAKYNNKDHEMSNANYVGGFGLLDTEMRDFDTNPTTPSFQRAERYADDHAVRQFSELTPSGLFEVLPDQPTVQNNTNVQKSVQAIQNRFEDSQEISHNQKEPDRLLALQSYRPATAGDSGESSRHLHSDTIPQDVNKLSMIDIFRNNRSTGTTEPGSTRGKRQVLPDAGTWWEKNARATANWAKGLGSLGIHSLADSLSRKALIKPPTTTVRPNSSTSRPDSLNLALLEQISSQILSKWRILQRADRSLLDASAREATNAVKEFSPMPLFIIDTHEIVKKEIPTTERRLETCTKTLSEYVRRSRNSPQRSIAEPIANIIICTQDLCALRTEFYNAQIRYYELLRSAATRAINIVCELNTVVIDALKRQLSQKTDAYARLYSQNEQNLRPAYEQLDRIVTKMNVGVSQLINSYVADLAAKGISIEENPTCNILQLIAQRTTDGDLNSQTNGTTVTNSNIYEKKCEVLHNRIAMVGSCIGKVRELFQSQSSKGRPQGNILSLTELARDQQLELHEMTQKLTADPSNVEIIEKISQLKRSIANTKDEIRQERNMEEEKVSRWTSLIDDLDTLFHTVLNEWTKVNEAQMKRKQLVEDEIKTDLRQVFRTSLTELNKNIENIERRWQEEQLRLLAEWSKQQQTVASRRDLLTERMNCYRQLLQPIYGMEGILAIYNEITELQKKLDNSYLHVTAHQQFKNGHEELLQIWKKVSNQSAQYDPRRTQRDE